MKLLILIPIAAGMLSAQSGNDKLSGLLQERALFDAVSRLKTDDRIAMFETLAGAKPEDLHYQNQMAATFLQKMRETMNPDYLNRAARIVEQMEREVKTYGIGIFSGDSWGHARAICPDS